MRYKTRAEFEDAINQGQAFTRLELTPDYAATIARWLEEELQRPGIIDVDAVKDPNLLKEHYWMLQGRKEMLYALCEQIETWRNDASRSVDEAPAV